MSFDAEEHLRKVRQVEELLEELTETRAEMYGILETVKIRQAQHALIEGITRVEA